jgi:hypothetical protein
MIRVVPIEPLLTWRHVLLADVWQVSIFMYRYHMTIWIQIKWQCKIIITWDNLSVHLIQCKNI